MCSNKREDAANDTFITVLKSMHISWVLIFLFLFFCLRKEWIQRQALKFNESRSFLCTIVVVLWNSLRLSFVSVPSAEIKVLFHSGTFEGRCAQ